MLNFQICKLNYYDLNWKSVLHTLCSRQASWQLHRHHLFKKYSFRKSLRPLFSSSPFFPFLSTGLVLTVHSEHIELQIIWQHQILISGQNTFVLGGWGGSWPLSQGKLGRKQIKSSYVTQIILFFPTNRPILIFLKNYFII